MRALRKQSEQNAETLFVPSDELDDLHLDSSANETLHPAMDGGPTRAWAQERLMIPFSDGEMACNVSGNGPPLLLIHSINAAASGAEMADLAEEMSDTHRVYNLDLQGFGDSARPDVRYDVERFVSAIEAAVMAIQEAEACENVDAAALSLSCEFLARSASRHPGFYRTLTFITPTGFQKGADKLTGPVDATFEQRWLSWILSRRTVGRSLYHALTWPFSIRFFLERTFGSELVDPMIYVAALRTSRIEGAEHAPLAFISGRLFSRDVTALYQSLEHPVWVPHGTRGAFADFTCAGWTFERPNWRLQPMDAGAMPHVEHPETFAEDYRAFLRRSQNMEHRQARS